MIKITLKIGKIVVSGVIAFTILTLFCHFYYNIPIPNTNKDGSTDKKWEPNTFYSTATEGFGWGTTNNDGFINTFDYDENMKIDILIMGSSHMQAFEVDMRQSAASRLNALLENETVYNIGISAHVFLICANNLSAALKKYQPAEYVVIETHDISFPDEDIALAISEETPELPAIQIQGKIAGLLRKNPYLRLIKYQMDLYLLARGVENVEAPENFAESHAANNENLMADLLHKMSALTEEYGTRLIIVYHPSINIAVDGAIDFEDDPNTIAQFKRLCDDNGILFLDMSNRFKEEYESKYIVPHGFSNSPVGKGHLNKYGHAMMADELYSLISEDRE